MRFLCNLLFDNYPKIVYYYYINKREVIQMEDYKVYFENGNERIFSTDGIYNLVGYLYFVLNYEQHEIRKIEKVVDK